MKKSQIFDRICTRCADVCEVRRDSILNSRCRLMSVVDARCIALSFLSNLESKIKASGWVSLSEVVPFNDLPVLVMSMAVEKLKEPDRKEFVRSYFGL